MIRGMTRIEISQDTTTGLWVLNADILIRADSASEALRMLEEAIRDDDAGR